MSDVAQKLLLNFVSLIIECCTMKQLIKKLEAFFLAMSLVENCEFRRGLQVRAKSANPAAIGKFPF